jgi:Zn-finger nucleic acid-binding protein
MNCPACKDAQLVMTERQGVEIDYCPTCRGVWLDRGELDKIIERSAPAATAQPLHGVPLGHSGHHSGHGDDHYKDGRRKKSFLSELFD